MRLAAFMVFWLALTAHHPGSAKHKQRRWETGTVVAFHKTGRSMVVLQTPRGPFVFARGDYEIRIGPVTYLVTDYGEDALERWVPLRIGSRVKVLPDGRTLHVVDLRRSHALRIREIIRARPPKKGRR